MYKKLEFWSDLSTLLFVVFVLLGGAATSSIVVRHHPDAWVWPTLFWLGQVSFVVAILLGTLAYRRSKKNDPTVLKLVLDEPAVRGIAEIKRLQESWSDTDVIANSLSCYHKCLLLTSKGKLLWLSDDTTEEREFNPVGD